MLLKKSHFRDTIYKYTEAEKERRRSMAVNYKKLFHLLIDRNITPAELQKKAGYSANISTRLRRNTYVSLESIEKICQVLNCKIDDIVDFVLDKNAEKSKGKK